MLNLLPGEANLFLGQSYVGDYRINTNTVQDTLSFSLGRDEGIIVDRSQIDASTGKLNWQMTLQPSQTQTLRFVYEITYPSGKQIEQKEN